MDEMPAVERVERALKRLRKDDGLSLAKLHRDEDLRGAFGEYQAIEMYNFIALGLEEIPAGLPADAARVALNVRVRRPKDDTGGAAKNNLTARRRKLAARWARADGFADHSKLGAVRLKESEGLLELAVWMVGSGVRLMTPGGTSEHSFVWADEDTTYIIRQGMLKQVYYVAEIRSLQPGLQFIQLDIPLMVGAARLPEMPWSVYGCSAMADVEPTSMHIDVTLSRSLHFGETHRFCLEVDVYGIPYTAITTPLQRRERATMRLQFDRPYPYRLIVDGQIAAVDGGGYFSRTWHEFGGSAVSTEIDWENEDVRSAIDQRRNAL